MRWLFVSLVVTLLVLQYRLWFGEGSFAQKVELSRKVEQQTARNERLQERNRVLAEEVDGLRSDPDAIEERARADLGMIRSDETFFLVLDKPRPKRSAPAKTERPVEEPREVVPEDLFVE